MTNKAWKGAAIVPLMMTAAFLTGTPVTAEPESYSPYAGQTYPTNVYFGDTHLHTNVSFDAYGSANRLPPEVAYKFAKGEEITLSNGQRGKLGRPLDFLVVADHGLGMGILAETEQNNPLVTGSEEGKARYAELQAILQNLDDPASRKKLGKLGYGIFSKPIARNPEVRQYIWNKAAKRADDNNTPGKFTAFIGYEWSAGAADGTMWHRVVIYRDSAEKAAKMPPFSAIDSQNPEELWHWMGKYQQKTGGNILAIPHNAGLSGGRMFAPINHNGEAITQDYARMRRQWEPLVEATQMKGDSETHPLLSPSDTFANFDTWGTQMRKVKTLETDKTRPYNFIRSALKNGLEHKITLGTNPFKFGMIGSTDAHTSMAGAEENNFLGKNRPTEPHPGRVTNPRFPGASGPGWWINASGYAAVWAEENTRESLFAAMKRRETYATTGPRMAVRFFGGWNYEQDDAKRPDLAKIGYAGGVPMGGDLTTAPRGKVPNFLIRAVKDPNGANLDRVQVIKGWRSADGELHEKIYNVALSGGRKDKGSKTREVGSTVDVKDASYTNTIGEPELATVWRDPDFKADELAFYYVRVLEIPTPRWTAYDAKYYGLTDIPEDVPMVHQERAYSSPIWYTP